MPSSAISRDNKNKEAVIFSGEGALSRLDTVLPNYKNILLFNDANGFQPCGAAHYFKQAEAKLQGKTRIQYVPYEGKALPIEDIEAKYLEVKSNIDVDAIIAVGGGTIIDLAKIISIACSNNCEKAGKVLTDKKLNNRLDLIFIPTTAGTGSEATSFAVVYKDKTKFSVDNQSLLPHTVVLDPLLLKSLPVHVLNSTVLDALAQGIESTWAKGATNESRQYAKQAIGLILDNIDKENSLHRLEKLQSASHAAGKAINISKTTLPHSISYPMTSHFNIPHGIAVFLTLPNVTELNYHTDQHTLQPGVQPAKIKESFSLLFSLFQVETIDQLVEKLHDVMVKLKIKTQLRDYGIERKDLSFLAAHALTKGRSDNNPRSVDNAEILKILENIF
jgi:alcohol dehydrogenase class IV